MQYNISTFHGLRCQICQTFRTTSHSSSCSAPIKVTWSQTDFSGNENIQQQVQRWQHIFVWRQFGYRFEMLSILIPRFMKLKFKLSKQENMSVSWRSFFRIFEHYFRHYKKIKIVPYKNVCWEMSNKHTRRVKKL